MSEAIVKLKGQRQERGIFNFSTRSELLRSKPNRNMKKRVIKTSMWSRPIMVLYGSETWTVNKRIQNEWRLLKCDRIEQLRKSIGQNIGPYNKRRRAGNDWRRQIPDTHNKKKTK